MLHGSHLPRNQLLDMFQIVFQSLGFSLKLLKRENNLLIL